MVKWVLTRAKATGVHLACFAAFSCVLDMQLQVRHASVVELAKPKGRTLTAASSASRLRGLRDGATSAGKAARGSVSPRSAS